MKPTHRIGLLALFVFSFVLALSAQDSNQSLGDFARQERERKQQSSDNSWRTDTSETAGLTEANFKANILITESHEAIEKWVKMPDAGRSGAARIRNLTSGKTYYLPFVVTGYAWQPSEKMNLTAHVQFVSPAGKLLFAVAKLADAIAPDPRSPSVIVLNPVMELTFDPEDVAGTYTMRVTITDHIHSVYAKAEEQFHLIQGTGSEGKAVQKPAAASQPESR